MYLCGKSTTLGFFLSSPQSIILSIHADAASVCLILRTGHTLLLSTNLSKCLTTLRLLL